MLCRVLWSAVFGLALLAPALAQESGSRLVKREVVVARNLYFDVDAQTVLSRSRVDGFVADLQVVRSGNGLEIVPVKDAGFHVADKLPESESEGQFKSTQRFKPEDGKTFFVRTDKGCYARLRVLYIDRGVSQQEAIEVGLAVVYQTDGTPRFPEPLAMAEGLFDGSAIHLRWDEGVAAEIAVLEDDEWKPLGKGTGQLDVTELEPERAYTFRIVRAIDGVGESEPLFVSSFTAQGMYWGEVTWSQEWSESGRPLYVDGKTSGQPDFVTRVWGNLVIEAVGASAIMRHSNGVGMFYGLSEYPAEGYRGGSHAISNGDVLVFRDQHGRYGKMLAATQNWWMGRLIYAVTLDGSRSLAKAPTEPSFAIEGKQLFLSWKPVEGASKYKIYKIKDLGFLPTLLGEATVPCDTIADIGERQLVRLGLTAVLADGRETAMQPITVPVYPDNWEYGTFELGASQAYDFSEGKSKPYTGSERVDLGMWDASGLSLAGSFGVVQPYVWDGSSEPPPFGTVNDNIRQLMQGASESIYFDPNGPGSFWLRTEEGDFVLCQIVRRSVPPNNMNFGGMWIEPTVTVASTDQSVMFEYVRVRLTPEERMDIMAREAPGLAETDLAKVPDLITQLIDPDPERRDAAEKELVGLGTGVVPAIRDALESEPEGELTFRLQRVIEELWNAGTVGMTDAWGGKMGAVVGIGGPMVVEADVEWPFPDLFEDLGSNPWDDVEKGEFVKYQVGLPEGAGGIPAFMTVKVENVLDEEVEISTKIEGGFSESQTQRVGKDEWFDIGSQLGGMSFSAEVGEEYEIEDAELTVGETTHTCKKVRFKLDLGGFGGSSDLTIWYAPEVPVHGILRIEAKIDLGGTGLTTYYELVESGKAEE